MAHRNACLLPVTTPYGTYGTYVIERRGIIESTAGKGKGISLDWTEASSYGSSIN